MTEAAYRSGAGRAWIGGQVRIAFFGLPLAACLLHADGHEIAVAALSREDETALGKRRLRRLIGDQRVVVKPRLDARLLKRIEGADLLVSWFWTNKIPPAFVSSTRLGGFGVHPSLLPRHRGPDPTTWAILSGDTETGVTAHRIAAEYDTGAILAQRAIAIDPSWNAWELAKALDRPSLQLLREVCAAFARGAPPPDRQQNEALATDAPFLSDDQSSLVWDAPTVEVMRTIRALTPSPGVFTSIGDRDVSILRARPVSDVPGVLEAPGEAAMIGGRALVKTRDGAIELLAVEHDGRTLVGAETAALLT